MSTTRTLLLSMLLIAVSAEGEEMDHSQMDHSQVGAASGEVTPARSARPSVHEDDNAIHSYMSLDRLEIQDAGSRTAVAWELKGWIGTDLSRLWLRSEGKLVSGHAEASELEVLYGRSISAWWDVVAGLRRDTGPGDAQSFGAIGIQGLAPQRIELEATAYIGQGGQFAARAKAEYQILFTNRLVLQPRLEADLNGKTDAGRGTGSGLSAMNAGLRLRYEFTRQFAPYIGVEWKRAFGDTARLRRAAALDVADMRLVAGVRTWF
jgi:copper resistance protein B